MRNFSNCVTGKRQYEDGPTATAVLNRMVERWNNGTIEDPCFAQRAYRCPDCGYYHLTKQPARRPNPTDVFPTLKINIGGVR